MFVFLDELIDFMERLKIVVLFEDIIRGRDGLNFYFFSKNFAIDDQFFGEIGCADADVTLSTYCKIIQSTSNNK